MNILLYENQIRFLNENYTPFNLEEFAQIKSFAKRVQYCDERLKKLGVGSSRIAYFLEEGKVLKIAKNRKGVAQNEVESGQEMFEWYSDIISEVYQYDDENYLWLISELAVKAKKSDFKNYYGVDIDVFYTYLYNVHKNYKQPKKPIPEEIKEQLDENELVQSFSSLVGDFDIAVGDLARTANFGVVTRHGQRCCVLIDSGATNNIINDYYSR